GFGGRGQGGPGGPGGFGGDAFRTMMDQSRSQAEKAIASVLDPNQIKRLRQILLQAEGPMAVAENEELQNALKLVDFQRKQIAMIVQEMELKQDQAETARREVLGSFFQNQQGQQGQGEQEDRRRGRPQIDPETQAKIDQLEAQGDRYKKEAI